MAFFQTRSFDKSENFDNYDLSDVAPESKDPSVREDESKELLKYQLRLAKEEIENLKSSKNVKNENVVQNDVTFDNDLIDALVLDYLGLGYFCCFFNGTCFRFF